MCTTSHQAARFRRDPSDRDPQLEALVQHFEITDDASAAAARLAAHVPGASEADLLSAPFVWIGTIEKIRGHCGSTKTSSGSGVTS